MVFVVVAVVAAADAEDRSDYVDAVVLDVVSTLDMYRSVTRSRLFQP